MKQEVFNEIKGFITELQDHEKFCYITIKTGKEKPRDVNFIILKERFDKLVKEYSIGDFVTLQFYVSSKNKHGKWYTVANVISWNELKD
jgi:hypothetical protein